MSHNEAAIETSIEQRAEPVRCNNCGWTGDDADLEAVSADSQDGEPSRPCPRCRTDHYLMDVDDDPASTLANEMLALLRRIGALSPEAAQNVAGRIDEARHEPEIAAAIAELSEVFEISNP